MRCGSAVTLALVCMTGAAAAEPSSQERALAESLFREAKGLAKAERYADACPKFEESHRLDPQLGTLLHLATCHEEQGKTASAWAEYSAAVELASERGDRRREKLASDRAAALEPTLSRLTLTREGRARPAAVTVRLDQKPIGEAMLGTAMPVDPGEHVVTVSADGYATWTREVRVEANGARVALRIGDLRPTREEPAPPDEPPPAPSTSGMETAGWVILGVGAASLLAGGGLGIAAALERDAADEECEGRFCSDEGLAGHDTAQTYATISTVGFIVGLAGAGAGIALVAFAPSSPGVGRLQLTPTLGGGTLGFGGRW